MPYDRYFLDCIQKHTTDQILTKNIWSHIQICITDNEGNTIIK